MKFDEKINIKKEKNLLVLKEERCSNKFLSIMVLFYLIFVGLLVVVNINFFNDNPYIGRDLILYGGFVLFFNSLTFIFPLVAISYFKIKEINIDKKFLYIKNNNHNLIKKNIHLHQKINFSELSRAKIIKTNTEKDRESSGFYQLVIELKNKKEIIIWECLPLYELNTIVREINIFINNKVI